MPRRCTICTHPDRHAVEKALIAQEPFRSMASRFDVSTSALVRHRKVHLPARLVQAQQAGGDPEATDLAQFAESRQTEDQRQALDALKQLQAINAACLEVLTKARSSGNDGTLLRAVDRIHRQIELQARLLGELQEGQAVNVVILPEWHRIRELLVEAVGPHPEAREAVVKALKHAGP
jgi:hypothetical protein